MSTCLIAVFGFVFGWCSICRYATSILSSLGSFSFSVCCSMITVSIIFLGVCCTSSFLVGRFVATGDSFVSWFVGTESMEVRIDISSAFESFTV